jgi:hypothetical protein
MRDHKKFVLLLIFLSLIYCTKYKEKAPFFDGLKLEYMQGSIKTIYMVEVLKNNRFKIISIRKREPLSDDVDEFFVDAYGTVKESSFKDYVGGFSPIWLPVHDMDIGDTFDDGYTVLRKDHWKKWEVMAIKNPILDEESYFDLNSGYSVGAKGKNAGGYEEFLVATNANIPVEGSTK